MWWAEYGCSLPNPRGMLPDREYQLHLAILSGKAEASHEAAEKAKATGK